MPPTSPRRAAGSALSALQGPPRFSCAWTDGHSGVAWVEPIGELDLFATPQLSQALSAAQTAAGCVVLDLRRVSFLESSACHAIVDASARAARAGGRLIVVRGLEHVQTALTVSGSAEAVEMVNLGPGQPPVQALRQ